MIGVDNLFGGDIENINSNVDFHKADCLDLDSMNKLIKECDIVYHAACTPHEVLFLQLLW